MENPERKCEAIRMITRSLYDAVHSPPAWLKTSSMDPDLESIRVAVRNGSGPRGPLRSIALHDHEPVFMYGNAQTRFHA
jgi:hypothetical protein